MGKYTIVIHGEGPHHNPEGQNETDANVESVNFVEFLKNLGHKIHSAVFNHSPDESGTPTKTDDLHAMTEPADAGQGEGSPGTERTAEDDAKLPDPESVSDEGGGA